MTTLPTQNEAAGFYGTIEGDKAKLYAAAQAALISRTFSPTTAQRLLDSSWGRHVADAVCAGKSIETALDEGMYKGTGSARRLRKDFKRKVQAALDDSLWN